MLPLHLDPALVLSGLPRPAGGQVMGLASLEPGETVQARVVDVLDDAMLVVLVKGLRLQASSLLGRLPVGQVFEAQVESHDGQILLRVDRPVAGRLGPTADPIAADRTVQAGGPRLAALLRALLPADEPLSDGISRLSASLSQAVERGQLPKQALADFESLRRLILLEGQAGGAALSAARLQEVLPSLGLTHEAELLAQVNGQGFVSPGSAANLKAWLMDMLGAHPEAQSAVSAASPSTPPAPSWSAVPSQPSLPASVRGGEPRVESGSAQPAAAAASQGRLPLGQGAEETGSPSPSSPSASFPRNESAKPVLLVEREPGSDLSLEREPRPIRHPSIPSPVNKESGHPAPPASQAPEPESGGAPPPAPASADRDHGKPQSAAPPASRPAPGLAMAGQRPIVVLAASPPVLAETAEAPAAQAQEPAWIRDAQRMLAAIERTQALASLNVQSGQPIYFDLPLAWGGQGQARIYVEPHDSGARDDPPQPRPYNVVTLLELDGLGAVRVDTVLTGKRLSARFLLDQPAVERAVAGLLPALTRSLSARGYQVDVVTSGTAEAGRLRGDDLRIKAAPRVHLVNFKV